MRHRGKLVNGHVLGHRGDDFVNQFTPDRPDARAAENFARPRGRSSTGLFSRIAA